MARLVVFLLPVALLFALSGCAVASLPVSTAQPREAPASSPDALPTAEPASVTTCDGLLNPSTIRSELGIVSAHEGTDGSWGYGTTQPSLVTLLEGDPGVLNCIWLSDEDPDVGVIISISTGPEAVASARAYLAPKSYREDIGPSGEQMFFLRGMEVGWTFTESHAFLNGLWVAVLSNFASEAEFLSDEAVASLVKPKI